MPTPTKSCAEIVDIIADLKDGKMVIMIDDEDRENEGDLIIVAEKARAEDINFMLTHGRGLLCLTLSRVRCEQLALPLMVDDADVNLSASFTVSIDAAVGTESGASAYDRARTIQTAVAIGARPEQLNRPGHVFPLMAQVAGVLERAGHTEAGCDLARLAGFEPAAAIIEVLNEDGSMARRPDLEVFAKNHDIKIGTIADLIQYRLDSDRPIERSIIG